MHGLVKLGIYTKRLKHVTAKNTFAIAKDVCVFVWCRVVQLTLGCFEIQSSSCPATRYSAHHGHAARKRPCLMHELLKMLHDWTASLAVCLPPPQCESRSKKMVCLMPFAKLYWDILSCHKCAATEIA